MSPAGIVRIVGDILCEYVRNNLINKHNTTLFVYVTQTLSVIIVLILVTKNDSVCAFL